MVFCLFYVSECAVAPAYIEQAVEDIVATSRKRSLDLKITGSLLFSGSLFAQFLEGPEESVRLVMTSIERDSRHRNVRVLLEEQRAVARFSSWSLAYSGPSIFVQRKLEALYASFDRSRLEHAVSEAVTMMREFARN